jgi:hypothetical protein
VDRPLTYNELLKRAQWFGARFVRNGEGSPRLWERVVTGRRLTASVPDHGSKPLGRGLGAVRRSLEMDEAHGVSDKDFYK